MTEQDAASDKLEQVLAQAVRQGISLDLKGTPDVPMVADRPVLRPAVIMRVALEASRVGISGPGIVVRGAHVDGDLYIIGYELRIGIELRDCTLRGCRDRGPRAVAALKPARMHCRPHIARSCGDLGGLDHQSIDSAWTASNAMVQDW
jgi:hypothetical protein